MLCKKPYIQGIQPYGCGQCLPCRLNRRRLWSHRLMLESYFHEESCFVTLTYDQENLPHGNTLVPKHPQDWLKRLRRNSSRKIRYFLVGEYGDDTQRAHYHAALFGVGYSHSELIRQSWGKGHVHIGDLTEKSAAYIAGYVTKKMTSPDDPRLNGRYPEFARMSLKPGIGAASVAKLTEFVTSEHGSNDLIRTGDVPSQLRHGKKMYPLGRYLRRKIREYAGFKEIGGQEIPKLQRFQEMSELLEAALAEPKNRSKTFGEILLEKNSQKVLNLEAKSKIFKKKGTL